MRMANGVWLDLFMTGLKINGGDFLPIARTGSRIKAGVQTQMALVHLVSANFPCTVVLFPANMYLPGPSGLFLVKLPS